MTGAMPGRCRRDAGGEVLGAIRRDAGAATGATPLTIGGMLTGPGGEDNQKTMKGIKYERIT
jgi:hypothetical protein